MKETQALVPTMHGAQLAAGNCTTGIARTVFALEGLKFTGHRATVTQ